MLCVSFTRAEIYEILPYLELHTVPWRHGIRPAPEAAFTLLLCRLSFPSQYKEMCGQFGRSNTRLCLVFLDIVEHLCQRYGEKLR